MVGPTISEYKKTLDLGQGVSVKMKINISKIHPVDDKKLLIDEQSESMAGAD